MQNKFENDTKRRIVIFLLILGFSWNLSQADDYGDNYPYFLDQDQDGLTDLEELALGTDPTNPDTDGDGYSDGVEVKSGYDPLVPAPYDRLDEVEAQKQRDLTANGLLEIEATRSIEIEDHFEASSIKEVDKIDDQEVEDLNITNLLIDGLSSTGALKPDNQGMATLDASKIADLQKIVTESGDHSFKYEPLSDNEVTILDETDDKDERREQLEVYATRISYIMATKAPFDATNLRELETSIQFFAIGLGGEIAQGGLQSLIGFKDTGKEAFDLLKKVETPYILADQHKRSLGILKALLEQDERKIFDEEDPIGSALFLGTVQSAIFEFQSIMEDTLDILEGEEVKIFADEKIIGQLEGLFE